MGSAGTASLGVPGVVPELLAPTPTPCSPPLLPFPPPFPLPPPMGTACMPPLPSKIAASSCLRALLGRINTRLSGMEWCRTTA